MSQDIVSSPPGWRLAPGVHAVAAEEDLVFLDVGADAYSCLPGGARSVRLAPASAALEAEDPDLIAALAAAGLIVAGGPQASPRVAPPRPSATALEGPLGSPGCRDLPVAAVGLFDLLRTYRGRGLGEILACAAATPVRAAPGPRSRGALIAAVERFHRWIPYAPVSGKCLLRSFMLLRCLRRAGHDAVWVFGVRTWPFAAHCWLQAGDLALDDDHERLTPFHPILAV